MELKISRCSEKNIFPMFGVNWGKQQGSPRADKTTALFLAGQRVPAIQVIERQTQRRNAIPCWGFVLQ